MDTSQSKVGWNSIVTARETTSQLILRAKQALQNLSVENGVENAVLGSRVCQGNITGETAECQGNTGTPTTEAPATSTSRPLAPNSQRILCDGSTTNKPGSTRTLWPLPTQKGRSTKSPVDTENEGSKTSVSPDNVTNTGKHQQRVERVQSFFDDARSKEQKANKSELNTVKKSRMSPHGGATLPGDTDSTSSSLNKGKTDRTSGASQQLHCHSNQKDVSRKDEISKLSKSSKTNRRHSKRKTRQSIEVTEESSSDYKHCKAQLSSEKTDTTIANVKIKTSKAKSVDVQKSCGKLQASEKPASLKDKTFIEENNDNSPPSQTSASCSKSLPPSSAQLHQTSKPQSTSQRKPAVVFLQKHTKKKNKKNKSPTMQRKSDSRSVSSPPALVSSRPLGSEVRRPKAVSATTLPEFTDASNVFAHFPKTTHILSTVTGAVSQSCGKVSAPGSSTQPSTESAIIRASSTCTTSEDPTKYMSPSATANVRPSQGCVLSTQASTARESTCVSTPQVAITAESVPIHAQTVPIHAQTVPIHAQTVTTYAQTVPSHAQTVPSHAQTVPTYAKTVPTHAQTAPTRKMLSSQPISKKTCVSVHPKESETQPVSIHDRLPLQTPSSHTSGNAQVSSPQPTTATTSTNTTTSTTSSGLSSCSTMVIPTASLSPLQLNPAPLRIAGTSASVQNSGHVRNQSVMPRKGILSQSNSLEFTHQPCETAVSSDGNSPGEEGRDEPNPTRGSRRASSDSVMTDILMAECDSCSRDVAGSLTEQQPSRTSPPQYADNAVERLTSEKKKPVALVTPSIRMIDTLPRNLRNTPPVSGNVVTASVEDTVTTDIDDAAPVLQPGNASDEQSADQVVVTESPAVHPNQHLNSPSTPTSVSIQQQINISNQQTVTHPLLSRVNQLSVLPNMDMSLFGNDQYDDNVPAELYYFHQLQQCQLQQQQLIEQELLQLEQRREVELFASGSVNALLLTGENVSPTPSSSSTLILTSIDPNGDMSPQEMLAIQSDSTEHSINQPSAQVGGGSGEGHRRRRKRRPARSTPSGVTGSSPSFVRPSLRSLYAGAENSAVPTSTNLVDSAISSTGGEFRRTRSAPRRIRQNERGANMGMTQSQRELLREMGIEASQSDNEDEPLGDRLSYVKSQLVGVPGVLIVSRKRGRLIVYLSRDRPNVQGVVRFMTEHGIPQHDYTCQVLPRRARSSRTNNPAAGATLTVQS